MNRHEIIKLLQEDLYDWAWYNPFGIPATTEDARAIEERKIFTQRRVKARRDRLTAKEREEVETFLQEVDLKETP